MLGCQAPRLESVPDGVEHPDGEAAVELVAAAGLKLDPWQEHVFRKSLLQRDGKWAAFEVAVVCPRQNGKNALLEARQLAGLFILGERFMIHSAHLADTSKIAFRRLDDLIQANGWLAREVAHVWRTNGHEAIELKNGATIRFRTRTSGGGRGFSGSPLFFDEAMDLPEASVAAILPVISAQPNPQLWFTGSAVDQMTHDQGHVFSRVRARGVAGNDPNLAFFEWSVAAETPDDLSAEVAADPASWAQANPSMGIRISGDYIAKEHAGPMSARSFAVERLGVGDWPSDGSDGSVISVTDWLELADSESRRDGPLVFAFDVTPDRSRGSICVAGRRSDDLLHVEVVEQGRGTGWIPQRLIDISEKHQPVAILCDGISPAASLIPDLEKAGVDVTTISSTDHAQACGMIYDAVAQKTVRHLGTPELTAAIRGAVKRPLGDSWAWSRKNSSVDISPLVAGTLALWGASTLTSREIMVAWG